MTVRELHGDERDRIYDEQARRYPGFAEYAERTKGIRTIPVLSLTPDCEQLSTRVDLRLDLGVVEPGASLTDEVRCSVVR